MTLVNPTTKLHTMLQSVVQINTGYPTTRLHTMLQSCHQPTKSYRVCNTDSDTQWYQFSHHYTTNKTTATYMHVFHCFQVSGGEEGRKQKAPRFNLTTTYGKMSPWLAKTIYCNTETQCSKQRATLCLKADLLLLLLTNTFTPWQEAMNTVLQRQYLLKADLLYTRQHTLTLWQEKCIHSYTENVQKQTLLFTYQLT